MRKQQRGFVLLYALVFVLLLVAGIAALAVGFRGIGTVSVVLIVVCTVGALIGLAIEFRQDPLACITFTAALTGGALAMAVAAAFTLHGMGDPIRASLSAAVVLGGLFLAQLLFLHRQKHLPEDPAFPDLVRQIAPTSPVFERSGVHISGWASTSPPFALVLLFQNCWTAERRVSIRVDYGSIVKAGPALVALPPSLVLQAAEVGRLEVPVVSPANGRPFSVHFDLEVTGGGGKRVRHRQGHPLSRRITPGAGLALVPLGMYATGGGIEFRFPAVPPAPYAPEPIAASWDRIWAPSVIANSPVHPGPV
jgi:hypothetical protein